MKCVLDDSYDESLFVSCKHDNLAYETVDSVDRQCMILFSVPFQRLMCIFFPHTGFRPLL
jgi:hypothetical protein